MKKFFSEFKAFALKGNVVDMAVGVIIGGAFGAIVSSLINDIFMPLLGLIIKVDFSQWGVVIGDNPDNLTPGAAAEQGLSVLYYGKFISAIIYFVLIALAIFIVVRVLRKAEEKAKEAKKKDEPAPEPEKAPRLCPFCKQPVADDATRCPHCTSEIPLE
jgi:large conductance mechanosensitive channel